MKVTIFLISLMFSGWMMAAEKLAVELTGGFHAVTERLISTGLEQSAFVYSVLGAIQLTDKAGRRWSFSIDCLGFDEVGSTQGTAGIGRCSWADADSDKLYVSLQTEGESNRYKIKGGTGKWAGAQGEIVSHFEYLPAPSADVYLGVDRGRGYLSEPATVK